MKSKNYITKKSFRMLLINLKAIRYCCLIIFLNCNLNLAVAQSSCLQLVAKGSKLQKLAGDFAFTEGPACNKKGDIFFTDQPNNRIMKWSTDNKLSTFSDHSGRANGMYFDHIGNLITCSDENNELWSISPAGKIVILAKEFEGKRLNGPNDLWITPEGGIYLTDPFYKRPWWNYDTPEQKGEHVYYLPPGGSKLIRVLSDLQQPNGIIGSPDGKLLYIADIRAGKTWRYTIGKDGTLSDKNLFANQGSDGMTIDNRGNIYLTGNGVTVYNKKGVLIAKIPIEERWTANVCFGGKDRHLLFITASTSVYGLKMKVRGLK
jgi:gluconolactonase